MTQNTYWPANETGYEPVETSAGTLTPGDYKPDRVAELVNIALAALGLPIPPTAFIGVGDEDTLIAIMLPSPTQQQKDDALTALNAVCVDPTRNNLSSSEIDAADLAAELATIADKITDANADIAAINDLGGLKDQINATTTGLIDQLLTNAAWNALTADEQADILRTVLKAALIIMRQMLVIDTHQARADKFELREIRSIRGG